VQYGISPVLLLDNYLSKAYPGKISGLVALKKPQYQDVTVLIASDEVAIFEDLRKRLYAVYPKEKCVDLFFESYQELVHPLHAVREVEEAMEKIQASGMMDAGMIYAPSKTHAKFFLPFAHTDLIQREILLTDDYMEIGILKKVFAFENGRIAQAVRGKSVLDIGANIGNHSLYFSIEAGARKVVSFEPVPLTFAILKRNIEINGLEDRVEIHNCGLGARSYSAELSFMDGGNLGGSHIVASGTGNLVVKALDEMELPNDIAFVKIDVEGMEPEVVQGAMKMLKAQHPFVMMESFEKNAPRMLAVMEQLGYQHLELCAAEYLFY